MIVYSFHVFRYACLCVCVFVCFRKKQKCSKPCFSLCTIIFELFFVKSVIFLPTFFWKQPYTKMNDCLTDFITLNCFELVERKTATVNERNASVAKRRGTKKKYSFQTNLQIHSTHSLSHLLI